MTPSPPPHSPYSGTFDINREAVDGASPGMDQILFGALTESYNQVTELAAWTALYATSGITSPTSVTTDADLAVEARAMLKQIRGEQAAFDVRRGIGPDRIFFGSGVWSAALEAESASASGEPLYPYYNPTNRDATSTNNQSVQVAIRGTIGESATQATSAKVAQVRFATCARGKAQPACSGGKRSWDQPNSGSPCSTTLYSKWCSPRVSPSTRKPERSLWISLWVTRRTWTRCVTTGGYRTPSKTPSYRRRGIGRATLPLKRYAPEFLTDCPPRVEEWALSTAMLLLRASQRGGTAVSSPDGVVLPGGIGGAFDVRQRRGILGRQYGAPHVTIAGG